MKKLKPEYILFILGLLLYGATTSIYPFPGESAQLLVSHAGISPFPLHSHPLWSYLVSFFVLLPLPLALSANAFSVICAAFSVAVFYRILANLKLDSDYDEKSPAARLILGLSGSLYMLAMLPIWRVAIRAHYAPFDLLLFLLAIRLVQCYRDEGGMRRLVAIGIIFGLGIIEASLFLVSAPVIGLYIVYLMWSNGDVGARKIAIAAASFLIPLCFYFVPAWHYTTLPVYEWGGTENFWHTVWMVYGSSGRALAGQLNQVGWMLLLMVSLVPYIGAMWVKRSQPAENRGFSILLVALIVTVLTGTLLFNVKIAPWVLLRAARNFLMPEIMIATAFGISIGFWFAVFNERAIRKSRRGKKNRKLKTVFIALAGILTLSVAIVNFGDVRSKENRKFYRLARKMLGTLSTQRTIITQGILERYLAIVAADRNLDCKFINPGMASNPLYIEYIKSIVSTPRLASLANYSLSAMFREWIESTPEIASDLALIGKPDLWQKAGYTPVASCGLYLGHQGDKMDPEEIYKESKDFMAMARENFSSQAPPKTYAESLDRKIGLILSKNVNDLGVLMQHLNRDDLAFEPYQTAIALSSKNISAMLNLHTLKAEEGEKAPEIVSDLEEIIGQVEKLSYQAITRDFGYIRNEDSLRTLQEIVAAVHGSGKDVARKPKREIPEEDIATFKQITELVKKQKIEEASSLCRRLLEKEPSYDKVWILLGVLAYEKGDYDTVQECVDQMIENNEFWPSLVARSGKIAMRKGNLDKARNAFESIVAVKPENVKILEQLVKLDSLEGGTKRGNVYLERLLALESENYIGNYTLGNRCYEDGDYELALSAYRKCAEKGESPAVLNNMAWILNRMGKSEEALQKVRKSLEMNKSISSSWDTLGSILVQLGRYDEARKAIEKCLEIDPDNTSARITLIELTDLEGDSRKARELARELMRSNAELTTEERNRLEDYID